jgi:hypothetical protein
MGVSGDLPGAGIEIAGQFISVVSPQRMLAREASCSQFDAKLESPGRVNPKGRRERRVQSLLPDIARRRKAEMEMGVDSSMQVDKGSRVVKLEGMEMENPFESRVRQTSVVRGREASVVRGRETSVLRGRETSIARAREPSGARTIREKQPSPSRSSSASTTTTTETQTKQAVKQTVLSALRLHSIPSTHPDHKLLISHTVTAAMFALRHKTRGGKIAGMGEIGGVVEGILEVFLKAM